MNFMPAMNDYGDVDRRRMLGQTLMQGGMNMGSPLGALASIFGGLAGRYADKREKQLMADEKAAAEERRRLLGEALTRGGTSEMDIARAVMQWGGPEMFAQGAQMAIAANKPKAPEGIPATDFLTQYGDKFDGTPEQFASMAADGVVTGQELAGLKRKNDPKQQLEIERIQAQIAKEKALAAKAGRATGPQLTPMQQAMAALSPEEMAKAARIQMGLEARAVAGKPTSGAQTAAAQVSANSADTTLAALEDMLTQGQINTGPIMGRIGSAIPTSERQQFDSLVAQLAPDIKKLQRAAGEGAFSDADLQLLLRSMPNATTDEKANLEIIKQLRAKVGALGSVSGASSGTERPAAPNPGDIVDGYRFKGGNPESPTSWEPAQ